MRIYFVDEINKPIKCYSVVVCNDKYYTNTTNLVSYIDVADESTARYNLSSITLYSDSEHTILLPYLPPLYVNSFTTKQSITVNCVRVCSNDVDIMTLFNNNQFKLGTLINNRVVYRDGIENAVSDLIPVSYLDTVISATASLQTNRRKILCYDVNQNYMPYVVTQLPSQMWEYNNGTSERVYITTTQITDRDIKYVRIQIPLATNSLTVENLPTDEFLNTVGIKGTSNTFSDVQNSIAFINRLKSAHNRKRG